MYSKHLATGPDAWYKFGIFISRSGRNSSANGSNSVWKGGKKEMEVGKEINFLFHCIQKQRANVLVIWYGVVEKLQTK